METKDERLPLLKTKREKPRHEITGYLLMILAALFFGMLGVLVRYVTAYRGLALPTVVLVRGLTQTTLTLVTMRLLPKSQRLFPKTQKLWWALALRGVLGALTITALFGSYKLLEFSIADSIFSISECCTIASHELSLTRPRHSAGAYFWQPRPARADKTTHRTGWVP